MSAQPIPKRIIICCDGTWQSAVSGKKGSPSNISRLCRSLERVGIDSEGKAWQQIVWYDSGVGTTSGVIGRMAEGAVGGGLEGNVIEAYNFVVLNYVPGDQIFCFGFSRGAYTARTIAGLISDIGVCSPREMNDFPDLWTAYKKMDGKRFYGSDEYFEWCDGVPAPPEKQPADLGWKNQNFIWEKHPRGEWACTAESREVEVVGVFDTVGAIGVPSVHGWEPKLPHQILGLGGKPDPAFHNVRLNRNIKHAFHALALDEHREAFGPTMYHLPEGTAASDEAIKSQEQAVQTAMEEFWRVRDDIKVPKEKRVAAHRKANEARLALLRMQESQKKQSELLQVWFPGVHINIGGGSSDTLKNEGDMEEMANITFAWMLEQIRPYLAINETVIMQEYRERQNHINDLNREVEKFQAHDEEEKEAAKKSWGVWVKRTASKAASFVTHPFSDAEPNLKRRDYGWGTGQIIDSYTAMYYANGSQARTPGAYAKDKNQPAPGQTNEQVHPSVGYRLEVTENAKEEKLKYTPIGMDRTKFFRTTNKAGEGEYSINGVILPEYSMKAQGGPNGPNFERLAVQGDQANQYIAKLYGED